MARKRQEPKPEAPPEPEAETRTIPAAGDITGEEQRAAQEAEQKKADKAARSKAVRDKAAHNPPDPKTYDVEGRERLDADGLTKGRD